MHFSKRTALVLFIFTVVTLKAGLSCASILTSKHNLSVTGPGELKALTEKRVCIFCHTPHNAAPQTPLWNKDVGHINYITYYSSTLTAIPDEPEGPSRLCLSCHDGMIALGEMLTEKVLTTGEITPYRKSYIGTDLEDDHPISISYIDAMAGNHEIVNPPPSDPRLIFYGNNLNVECSTCHDAHDDSRCSKGYDCKFLVMDNAYSELCLKCHRMKGWKASTEANSTAVLDRNKIPDPWEHTEYAGYITVAENGCENCHVPHSAKSRQRLLIYDKEEEVCYTCHDGTVAIDVKTDFQKQYHHGVEKTTGLHDPTESPISSGHVECVDCHNPHAYNNSTAKAPYVSGSCRRVKGISKDGAFLDPSQLKYQYEICFRCHGDNTPVVPGITRVVDTANTMLEFSLNNPSFHPVEGMGKNPDMPSLPSTLEPTLTAQSIIYCTDCHDSDTSPAVGGTGAKGPHGSKYPYILREKYETNDYTQESYSNYALCYRCHNRDSILSDESFPYHYLHVVTERTPCSVCHDPHGVLDYPGTGSHSHLINFDTTVVLPAPGQRIPYFTDNGNRSGSCTLTCHNSIHTGNGKYVY